MKIFALVTTLIAASIVQPAQASGTRPFEGAWEHCDSYRGAQYCSSYLLLQAGANVCGIWEYTATNSGYFGKLQATAVSPKVLRKDRVCGSPGSETQTECSEEGTPQIAWEPAHGNLYLIGNGMDDSESARRPYFHRRAFLPGERAELLAQPWASACLARTTP